MREGIVDVDNGVTQSWIVMMKAGCMVKKGRHLPVENTESS